MSQTDQNQALEEIEIRAEGIIRNAGDLHTAAIAIASGATLIADMLERMEAELVNIIAAVKRIEREGE
jgi:hypothetical protein